MPDAAARAKAIRLALFDVDGVLTDGRLYYGPDGEAMKVFSILDGHGLKMLARSGVATGLLSGRPSQAAAARARELGPLRPGLTVPRAGDELFMLNDSAHYLALVTERGWSEKAFERWLASGMSHSLLG